MENPSHDSPKALDSRVSDPLLNLILTKGTITSNHSQDPVFLDVLGEVSTGCLDNLSTTLNQLHLEQRRLHTQIEELAAEHYPVFLAKAEASQTVLQKISDIVSLNEQLVSKLPGLIDDSKMFLSKADKFGSALQINSKALDKHTQLLELLELPQLMETCVHNGHFDDAIAILSFAKKLVSKHGTALPTLRMIGSQVEAVGSQLVHHLCNQLRSPISLPACIKVVVFLRRTGVFTEPELRLKFLQARNSCLDTQLITSFNTPRIGESGHKDTSDFKGGFRSPFSRTSYEAYWRATRRIEVTRVQLFDIATQYRTIFTEEEALHLRGLRSGIATSMGKAGQLSSSSLRFSPDAFEDRPQKLGYTLFHAWLIYQITGFLNSIAADLSQMVHQPLWNVQEVLDHWAPSAAVSGSGIGSTADAGDLDLETLFTQLQSLTSQTMYFGRSFTRIGCDFRPHLVDVLNNAILSFVQAYLENVVTEFSIALGHLLWKMPDSTVEAKSNESDSVTNVDQLLGYPPLVLLYNRFAALYNGLRVCCPLGLRSRLIILVTVGLKSAASRIVSVYRVSLHQQPVNWRSDAASMSEAFDQILVPTLMDGLVNRLRNDHSESEKLQPGSGITVQRLRELICKVIHTCFPRPTVSTGLSPGVDPVSEVPVVATEN
ncbi:Conserved oligomeric Golgi complex subunit 8 [Fasciola gigantica]|uniref:Conserved oligomeric Golgi complex subunit 8 n=1 Tax=Fasciola gigantica TaxID=46835 RepID=A0A504YVE7_FASGI|nr:Conserved oligomeric Golgi complex subunit 8 [Fasciola gigantica]